MTIKEIMEKKHYMELQLNEAQTKYGDAVDYLNDYLSGYVASSDRWDPAREQSLYDAVEERRDYFNIVFRQYNEFMRSDFCQIMPNGDKVV